MMLKLILLLTLIAIVVCLQPLQDDLEYIKNELVQLRADTENLKSNITSLRNENQHLIHKLESKEKMTDSAHSAMQNDMQYLQKLVQYAESNISSILIGSSKVQQTVSHIQSDVSLINQKFNTVRAFTVSNSKAFFNLENKKLIFNDANTNMGGRYDTGSGIYTSDIAGWYVFFFTVRVRYYSHVCAVELLKNGSRIVFSLAMSGVKYNQHSSESNMAVVHLEVGDTVWLQATHWGGTCDVDDLSSFSGFLLTVA